MLAGQIWPPGLTLPIPVLQYIHLYNNDQVQLSSQEFVPGLRETEC